MGYYGVVLLIVWMGHGQYMTETFKTIDECDKAGVQFSTKNVHRSHVCKFVPFTETNGKLH